MTGLSALVGLVVLCVAVPIFLVYWSRSASMFSGKKVPDYDGPRAPLSSNPNQVRSTDEVSVPGLRPGEGLSEDESEAWESLTSVSWNMPFRQ